jgi:uncharacterized membrane protein YgaE (UPF0421/DUF939 family)
MAVPLAPSAGWAQAATRDGGGPPARLVEVARAAWPLLQGTAAAAAAWVIATDVLNHHQPFFAPIAAVIALNAPLGRRGGNAVRLLLGVIVGILVGEFTVEALGSDWTALAVATFVAMAIATVLDGSRVLIAQAAASAILVVAVSTGGFGAERLSDALIGAGVALAFSQLLFSPDPVALLRRAEGAALVGMGDGLKLTARALERDNEEIAEQAMGRLRRLNDRLAELGQARAASDGVARRTPVWRRKKKPVERERENARNLDVLGASCLVLARTAIDTIAGERQPLTTAVRDLSALLSDLSAEPGDRAARQHAADRALQIAHRLVRVEAPSERAIWTAVAAVRLVAAEIVVFAGVDPREAEEAVRDGGEVHVLNQPSTPRIRRRSDRSAAGRTASLASRLTPRPTLSTIERNHDDRGNRISRN